MHNSYRPILSFYGFFSFCSRRRRGKICDWDFLLSVILMTICWNFECPQCCFGCELECFEILEWSVSFCAYIGNLKPSLFLHLLKYNSLFNIQTKHKALIKPDLHSEICYDLSFSKVAHCKRPSTSRKYWKRLLLTASLYFSCQQCFHLHTWIMSLLLPLLCLFLALQWLITFPFSFFSYISFSFFFFKLLFNKQCALVLISWINIHDSPFQATRSSVDVCFTVLLSNVFLQNKRSFSFQRLMLECWQLSSTWHVIWSWFYYLDRYSFLALLSFAVYIFKATLYHLYLNWSTTQSHWSETHVWAG